MKASKWISNILNSKDKTTCVIDWEAVNEIDDIMFTNALLRRRLKEKEDEIEKLKIALKEE